MKKGKNAFFKEIVRSITHSTSRFLSILAIVALGAGFFAGINVSAPNMRITADKYLKEQNMMDVHLMSTFGFTEDDIKAIEETEGIKEVLPSYSVDAIATVGKEDKAYTMRIHGTSLSELENNPEYINKPVLVDGRFPKKTGECVIGTGKFDGGYMKIGDKITLDKGSVDLKDTLNTNEYTIVGIVKSPYYLSSSIGSTTVGNGSLQSYMFIDNANFKTEVYTDVFATVIEADDVSSFSKKYDEIIDNAIDNIKTTSVSRMDIRYEEVKKEVSDKIVNAQLEFNQQKVDVQTQLEDARKSILRGEEEIKLNQEKLDAAQVEHDKGVTSLDAKRKELENTFVTSQQQIDLGKKELQEKQQQLLDQLQGEPMPEEQKLAFEQKLRELNESQILLDQNKSAANTELDFSQVILNEALVEITDGREELEKAKNELEKGKLEFEDKKAEAETKLAEAQIEIDDAEESIGSVEPPEWYILDRGTNVGFTSFKNDSDRVQSIATVFPIIFFMVAALVALTTMTRMVEEERILIGTYKAMGYRKRIIISKYIIYAALASVVGSIAGTVLGSWLLPIVVWDAYSIIYTVPGMSVVTDWASAFGFGIAATAASVICTLGATIWACYSTLHEVPANLMLPRAPKAGKRILLERITPIWSKMSFSMKVTARNLFRYKKRLLMTVIGIAGCTSLLLTGFGIKDSVSDLVSEQYDNVYKYNTAIGIESNSVSQSLLDKLNNKAYFEDYMISSSKNTEFSSKSSTETAQNGYLFIPEKVEDLKQLINLKNRTSQKDIPFDKNSVVVTEKLAKILNVSAGDTLTILGDNDKKVDFKITGVTENYIYHYVYISPELYQSGFSNPPEYNQIVAITENSPEHHKMLENDVLDDEDILTVQFIDDMIFDFDDMISSLNIVIVVLIFCAGILAFIVLYNLTNINVTERQREIATIKVLGFFDKEVSSYIYRETAMLSIIGCGVGLLLGILMHLFVVQTVEIDMMMFGRKIHGLSYLWSALLTIGFSLIVNVVMYFKLKKIDMVESLKSVE